jgi:hypothetical protein
MVRPKVDGGRAASPLAAGKPAKIAKSCKITAFSGTGPSKQPQRAVMGKKYLDIAVYSILSLLESWTHLQRTGKSVKNNEPPQEYQ